MKILHKKEIKKIQALSRLDETLPITKQEDTTVCEVNQEDDFLFSCTPTQQSKPGIGILVIMLRGWTGSGGKCEE